MISRGAPGTHICWKCQLRLRQALPSNAETSSLLARPRGARTLHNAAGSRKRDDISRNYHDEDTPRAPHITKHIQDSKGFWRPLQKNPISEHPLGRLHGFRGHRLREKSAELRIDSLGTPSEVIVLRDAGFHSVPLPQIEELKVDRKVDILSQLDAERGLVTQSDVEKNIDGLRPKSNIISWDEIEEKQRELVSGFTISQLVKYSDTFKGRQKKADEQNKVGTQNAPMRAIIRKTEWVPGISETGDEFEESALRGYDSAAFTDKQRLVLLILRQCWRLEALEVIDSIGELELEIHSQELELLIEGQNPPLKAVTDKLISSQEERIEAFRSRGVVRITSTKDKSEIIVREIQDKLQSVRSLTVDLKALEVEPKSVKPASKFSSNAAYDQTVISKLSNLTDTHIKRLPGNQISISCIHTKSKTQLSTRADVARRLLLTSSDIANQIKTRQICKGDLESMLAIKYHMQSGMSWRDRLRNWTRWTSAKSSSMYASSTQLRGRMTANGLANEVQNEEPVGTGSSEHPLPARSSSEVSENPYWDRKVSTNTAIIIGHILHEVSVTPEVAARVARDTAAQRTMFYPKVVNISKLFGMMPGLNKLPVTSLVLRFNPSPWTAAGSEQLMSLPPVELRFMVDSETKEMKLKDVLAVVESTASDVMLPNRIHDLRFQQRTTARLGELHRKQLPQIVEFLNGSQLNLKLGRLETPPGLNLPIASHLCKPPHTDTLRSSVNGFINAEYIFGGLEYRSTLALDFIGWQLLYTSIEGGKADGRRGELSLKPWQLTNHISDNKTPAILTEEFVEAAYQLVDTLDGFEANVGASLSSATPINRREANSEPPNMSISEKNGDFQYFREKIDFIMKHTGGTEVPS